MPGLQKAPNKWSMDESVLTSYPETYIALSVCRLNSEEFGYKTKKKNYCLEYYQIYFSKSQIFVS